MSPVIDTNTGKRTRGANRRRKLKRWGWGEGMKNKCETVKAPTGSFVLPRWKINFVRCAWVRILSIFVVERPGLSSGYLLNSPRFEHLNTDYMWNILSGCLRLFSTQIQTFIDSGYVTVYWNQTKNCSLIISFKNSSSTTFNIRKFNNHAIESWCITSSRDRWQTGNLLPNNCINHQKNNFRETSANRNRNRMEVNYFCQGHSRPLSQEFIVVVLASWSWKTNWRETPIIDMQQNQKPQARQRYPNYVLLIKHQELLLCLN